MSRFNSNPRFRPERRDCSCDDYVRAVKSCGKNGASVKQVARRLDLTEERVKDSLGILSSSLRLLERSADGKRFFVPELCRGQS